MASEACLADFGEWQRFLTPSNASPPDDTLPSCNFNALLFFVDILQGSLATDGVLVTSDNQRRIIAVIIINVLESSVRFASVSEGSHRSSGCRLTSLGVEKIDDRHEKGVEDCENNPELPA